MSVPIAKSFVILAGGNSTVGPSAGGSTDNAVARWDGTTGRVLQNSTVIISDTGNITFGTAGSILSGTTGSQGITVTGTNQDFTILPSGTGRLQVGVNGTIASATPLIISAGGTYSSSDTVSSAAIKIRAYDNGSTASGLGSTPSKTVLEAVSGTSLVFSMNLTEAARFAVTTRNLLLGGLTTDGTGVLQFPAATTAAGGIAFGTDVNLYRIAANTAAIASNGHTVTLIDGNGNLTMNNGGGRIYSSDSSAAFPAFCGSTNNYGIWFDSTHVYIATAGTTALTLDSSQNATFAKLVTSYNGISTTGNGVSTVQASGRVTAQVAANASVSTYTVGASDASFRISANVLVTTATTHSFSMTCAYTDEGNVARTLTLGFTQLSGATLVTLITNVTGTGPYESLQYHIRCKANTAITFATTGTFTTVTYNAEGVITKVA